jgi:hypothetical protein
LQPQPGFRVAAECLVETDRHVGRNAALASDQIVEGLPRHPQCLCGLGDRQAERLYAIVPHPKAGVGRVFHRHRHPSCSLVVIDQIDIRGIVPLEL